MEKWNVPADYKSLYEQGFFKYLESPRDEGMNFNGIATFVVSLFRELLWGFIYILLLFVNVMETVFYKITTSFNIFSLIFKNNTSFFGGLAIICLFIGIVVAGFRIANPFSDDGKDFLKLLVKGLATVTFMLAIAGFSFITMENITSSISTKIIKQDNKSTSLITSMVGKNVYDIEETFKKKKVVNVLEKKVQFININDTIEDRDHEILAYKYNKVSANEIQREALTKHNDNIELNILKSNEFFYKYQFNFIVLVVVLGGLAALYLLNSLKFVRNTYEMFVGFAVFIVSTVDITNQERLKANINNILGLFFNNIYLIGAIFIATNFILIANTLLPVITANVGTLETSIIYVVVYLGLFWLMLDGAAIIQQTTGTDGGIRSGTQLIIATYAASKILGSPVGLAAGAALSKPASALAANKEAKQALKREKAINKLKDKELDKNKPNQKEDLNDKSNPEKEQTLKDNNKANEASKDTKNDSNKKVVNEATKPKDESIKQQHNKASNLEKETNKRFESVTKEQSVSNPFKEVNRNE